MNLQKCAHIPIVLLLLAAGCSDAASRPGCRRSASQASPSPESPSFLPSNRAHRCLPPFPPGE